MGDLIDRSEKHTNKRKETHACDLISRQDAITEFSCCELTPDGGIDANYAIDFLKHLPSVQPDSKELSFTHKALDTISRQAAIDAAIEAADDWDGGWSPTRSNIIEKAIENLPSAQPERKRGEWVLQSDDYHEYYECDQCGIAVGLDDVRNFCPNCGADMRGNTEQ